MVVFALCHRNGCWIVCLDFALLFDFMMYFDLFDFDFWSFDGWGGVCCYKLGCLGVYFV